MTSKNRINEKTTNEKSIGGKKCADPYLPQEVYVAQRIQEAEGIVSLYLEFTDSDARHGYHFLPGQFNMLYCGGGEAPISIVTDGGESKGYQHTIRMVGDVTRALGALKEGDSLGLRGPFGHGWPLKQLEGNDILVITGGIAVAPVVAAINEIVRNRNRYGRLIILQGVTHDLGHIFDDKYQEWSLAPNTQVCITSMQAGAGWRYRNGLVTALVEDIQLADTATTYALMCGPQPMMQATIEVLKRKGLNEDSLYVSMERNMQCGIGHCGHCQLGEKFICKDGPVFTYAQIRQALALETFSSGDSL